MTRVSSLPEYDVWAAMICRCKNPNSQSYPRYGGRGISVCARWTSFAAFYEDVGPRPSAQHSIGRKDNDGNYEPSNCRWETRAEQNNNKRTSRFIEFEGDRLTLSEWAVRIGISPGALRVRLYVLGWSLERALTTPAMPHVPVWKKRQLEAEAASRSVEDLGDGRAPCLENRVNAMASVLEGER